MAVKKTAKSEPLNHPRTKFREAPTPSEAGLKLLGFLVVEGLSIPDISRRIGRPISTIRRHVIRLEESGYCKALKGQELAAANRHRIQLGGEPATRLPKLFGRGRHWLSIAAEVNRLHGELTPARGVGREGRNLRVHSVILSADIIRPPNSALLNVENPLLEPHPFGKNGQVHFRGSLEIDGLSWVVVLWFNPAKGSAGWSKATLTLSKDCPQYPDAGQVHAFTLHIYQAAVRALETVSRTIGAGFDPMPLLDFAKRTHAALPIEGDFADFIKTLPASARQWTLADGRKVWADFSDGPEVESGLPSTGAADVLTVLDEAVSIALKNPELFLQVAQSIEVIDERIEGVAALLESLHLRLNPPIHNPPPLNPSDFNMWG